MNWIFFLFFYGLEQLYATIGKPKKLEISCSMHMQQMHYEVFQELVRNS